MDNSHSRLYTVPQVNYSSFDTSITCPLDLDMISNSLLEAPVTWPVFYLLIWMIIVSDYVIIFSHFPARWLGGFNNIEGEGFYFKVSCNISSMECTTD